MENDNYKDINELNFAEIGNEYCENKCIKRQENSIDQIILKTNKNFKNENNNILDSYNDFIYNRKYSRSNDKKINKDINLNANFSIDQIKKNKSDTHYSNDFDKISDEGLEVLNRGDSNMLNQLNKISPNFDTLSKNCGELKKEVNENIKNNIKNDLILNFDPNDKNLNYKMRRNQTVQIIKEGILKKKSPWFHYNTRKIILDSTPRIEYIDPILNKVKGSIYLSKNCEAKFIKHNVFELKTLNRTFKFKTEDYEAGIWSRVINECIEKYSRN